MELVIFSTEKMERFLMKDSFAKMMVEGLGSGTRGEKLEAVFNSIVHGDSLMEKEYLQS